ncbi:MAG TPA: NAD(P)/FAD-dependent oxidoreductase [Candidatus Anoxymicrobiaceae bacterium]
MKTKRAVVIGAGLGGMSAAAYLSKNGFKVDVFERNPHPGGYASSFVRGRFEFEAALHEISGIGPPEHRGGCYHVLEGCDVARRVEFIPINEFYTSIFPDFTVTIPNGWEAAEAAYAEQFPRERKGISRLMNQMRQINDELGALAKIKGPLDALSIPRKSAHLIRSFGITTEQAIEREISDPKLKALFCDIWGYYGLPPSRLSWMLFAVANATYLEYGPYHIKGTSQALSNAFVSAIEENGGTVHLRNGVRKINTVNGKVTGVVTDEGETVQAPYVVSNANPITACYDLIGKENIPASYLKSLAEGHIAISTYNVYMGLDCPASDLGVSGHEYFMHDSYDMDAHYRAMFTTDKQQYWVLTNYNHADPEFSPPGTSVMVITAVVDGTAWTRIPPDRYVETKERFAQQMIDATSERFPGLADHIEVVEVSTPITNMRYSGNPNGSILGFDYDVTGSPMMRLPNRGPLEGLYFAGAWVRMGGGFETCINSGMLAYGEVMKDVNGVKGLARAMPAMG